MRARLWALAPVHAGIYRKMRRQHPLDHGQDAHPARGASQEAASRQPFPGDRQSPSPQAVSQLPPCPTPGGYRGSSRPLPIHLQAKAWVAELAGTHVCNCTEEQPVSSLKEILAFVCNGKARATFTDSCCSRIWRAARKGGSAQTQTKSCCRTIVGGRVGGEAEWGCFCPWNVPVNKHVNTL